MGRSGSCWAALALASVCACQAMPETVAPRQYVGAASGDADSDLSIALAVQGPYVALFACTDDPMTSDYPGWLTADTYAGDGAIRLGRDQWSFEGSVGGDEAHGTLTGPNGISLKWSGVAAPGSDLSGLYATYDSGCITGVVVIDGPPAMPPIVRGAWCNAAGQVHQVIITAAPPHLIDGRLPVEVGLDDGPRKLAVPPVTLPLP
jgi:hypothetical protein